MPRPDFHSLACQGALKAVHTARLSLATYWLSGSEWAVLSKIIWISTYHALRVRKNTRSCMPSRPYFKRVIELSISTISRITSKLAKLYYVSKFQRRPVLGQFQTCLYKLEGIIREKVEAVIIEFLRIIDRVASTQHIVSKEHSIKIFREEQRSKTTNINGPPGDNAYYEAIRIRREAEYEGGR